MITQCWNCGDCASDVEPRLRCPVCGGSGRAENPNATPCPNCGRSWQHGEMCEHCDHTGGYGCDCDFCSEGETPILLQDFFNRGGQ